MKQCPRCKRNHSGSCGIPSRVTLDFGARVGRIDADTPRLISKRGSPKEAALKARGTQRLRGLLEWGKEERQKVLELLKIMPPNMLEYDRLLDRLANLEEALRQIKLKLK